MFWGSKTLPLKKFCKCSSLKYVGFIKSPLSPTLFTESIKGKTKYHSDLQRSGRPQENYELIKKGIEDIRISITPRNFQDQDTNESLKRVYKHLFI